MHPGKLALLALTNVAFLLAGQFTTAGRVMSGRISDPNAPKFTITGRVVNGVSGEGISHASVRLMGPGNAPSTFSDENGSFQIPDMQAGQYFPQVARPGFVARNGNLGVDVRDSSVVLTLKLDPTAVIQGHVSDQNGEPIEGVGVFCIGSQVINGRRRLFPSKSASTNENGEYRLDGIRPGTYVVGTRQKVLFPNLTAAVAKVIERQVFPARYYPGSPDQASAQPMTVDPGAQAQADFTLPIVRAYTISGFIEPAAGANGQVLSESGEFAGGIRIDPKGAWATQPVAPGSWRVFFMMPPRQAEPTTGGMLHAEERVEVSRNDVSNIRVAFQALTNIEVHTAGAPEGSIPMYLQLRNLQPSWQFPSDFSMRPQRGASKGPDQFVNVTPGSYRLSANVLGAHCLASVTSGGVDLNRDNLVVSAGAQPASIDVVLTDQCGSVQGRVQRDQAGPGDQVLLVPAAQAIDPIYVRVADDGSFKVSSAAPGEYTAYAFSSVSDLEYGNPEVMRQYSGQQVTLTAGQETPLNLKLITREAN